MRKIVLSVFTMLIMCFQLAAQNQRVTGTVTDAASGEPVMGATVVVKGTQNAAVTGMDGTLTTFQIEPERVTLLRVGEYTSQMVVQEGRRHMSMYNTPYGTMSIGVNTRHLTAQVGESGGDIEIDYAIEIDHTVAGRNVFQIKIKEAAPGCSLKQ